MKYYINEWYNNPVGYEYEYGEQITALFTNNKWRGEGNFCGWYSTEYWCDTTILAAYISGPDFRRNPHDFRIINQHFDKVQIGSCYYTEVLEADSDEEAIEKFKRMEFTKYIPD